MSMFIDIHQPKAKSFDVRLPKQINNNINKAFFGTRSTVLVMVKWRRQRFYIIHNFARFVLG